MTRVLRKMKKKELGFADIIHIFLISLASLIFVHYGVSYSRHLHFSERAQPYLEVLSGGSSLRQGVELNGFLGTCIIMDTYLLKTVSTSHSPFLTPVTPDDKYLRRR